MKLYTEKSAAGMESASCPTQQGSLPGVCAPLAFPYIPMQCKNPKQYDRREALQQGTLFPGLDLPFQKELKSRFPAVNSALSELMALDFAVDELGLYLTTHADDREALELYWSYIALAQEGRKRYQETYGPILQTDTTPDGYRWLNDPKLAAVIISQYGGPDGELGASLRYLSQRYAMPYAELKGLLTDIGTEELGHLEMIGTIVHQLTRNLSEKDIKTAGFDAYFVDHTTGVYPTAASGFPWNAASIAVTGDVIADLTEDLSAEQKARVTYDNILRLSDDPDVNDVIKFLRAREVVHFQRFGEGLRLAREKMDQKNVYFTNPAFDK